MYYTTIQHTFAEDDTSFADKSWLLVRQPTATEQSVIITMQKKSTSLRCKALGQTKPKISWVRSITLYLQLVTEKNIKTKFRHIL